MLETLPWLAYAPERASVPLLVGSWAPGLAREEVAPYLAVVGGLDGTIEFDPELTAALGERLAVGDRAGAGALVSGDLLDLFAFSGTPEQIAAQAEALYQAGATRVEFGTPHGIDERAGVELLGEVARRL